MIKIKPAMISTYTEQLPPNLSIISRKTYNVQGLPALPSRGCDRFSLPGRALTARTLLQASED